jgi:hypothetical protein
MLSLRVSLGSLSVAVIASTLIHAGVERGLFRHASSKRSSRQQSNKVAFVSRMTCNRSKSNDTPSWPLLLH